MAVDVPEPHAGQSDRELSERPGKGVIAYFQRATAAVPALRYALALGVIAVAIVLVAGVLDSRVALVGTLFVLLAMAVLIVISRAAEAQSQDFRLAIFVFVYFAIFMLIVVVVLFALTFFVRPDTLRQYFYLNSFYELVGVQPSSAVQRRNADQFIGEFDDAVGGTAAPAAVAAALERVTAFWRQPEQRELLHAYRCGNPGSKIIFERSAKYVFENPDLLKDVNTITRYYDAVARCVQRRECDPIKICGYYYQQMDDFQRQYTTYFHEIRLLEGRDNIANVRELIFQICPDVTAPPAEDEAPVCPPAIP